MAKKNLYSFDDHPEHRAELKPWADKWIANAMSTAAMTDEDRDVVRDAVLGLYDAARLPAPKHVVFSASPISATISTGVAAGVWYLREHPEQHQKLFGRSISEAELMGAIALTCSFIVRCGWHYLETLETPPPGSIKISDATRDATHDATHDATSVATRVATHDATSDATHDATSVATRVATHDATHDATSVATSGDLVRFLALCANRAWYMRDGGNQWSGWSAYLSFFRHVAKLDIDYSKWQHYELCAERSGPRLMHPKFCIVSDRPEVLKVDERNRPHCADGPSHRWRDGWELHYWHGVRVPKAWVTDTKNLDPATALTWPNIEQRRAAAEIIGWKRVLEQLSPKVINKHKDPEIGELLEVELPDAGTARFLKVRCGTGRDFVLSVPREMKTALEANAWTYDLKPSELKQLEART